jgi:hypothetical protein
MRRTPRGPSLVAVPAADAPPMTAHGADLAAARAAGLDTLTSLRRIGVGAVGAH